MVEDLYKAAQSNNEYLIQSKEWLFEIVRQFIIDNKIRNWSEKIPTYKNLSYDTKGCEFHYYSDVIEQAFIFNNLPKKLIRKMNQAVEKCTRHGYLKGKHGNFSSIITIHDIKRVIDNIEYEKCGECGVSDTKLKKINELVNSVDLFERDADLSDKYFVVADMIEEVKEICKGDEE